MSLQYIKNHVELANSRLVQQDKESYNFVKLLSALTIKLQEIEDALFYLFDRMGVFTAEGKTLDIIGEIVNEARKSRMDAEYRFRILRKIMQNNSCGTPEDIINLVLFFVKDISQIRLIETSYSYFFIEVRTDIGIDTIKIMKEIILTTKPVGVAFGIIVIRLNQLNIFDETYSEIYDYTVDKKSQNMLQVNINGDTLAVTLKHGAYINYGMYYNKKFPKVSNRNSLPNPATAQEDIYCVGTDELAIKIGIKWEFVLILWSN